MVIDLFSTRLQLNVSPHQAVFLVATQTSVENTIIVVIHNVLHLLILRILEVAITIVKLLAVIRQIVESITAAGKVDAILALIILLNTLARTAVGAAVKLTIIAMNTIVPINNGRRLEDTSKFYFFINDDKF